MAEWSLLLTFFPMGVDISKYSHIFCDIAGGIAATTLWLGGIYAATIYSINFPFYKQCPFSTFNGCLLVKDES